MKMKHENNKTKHEKINKMCATHGNQMKHIETHKNQN